MCLHSEDFDVKTLKQSGQLWSILLVTCIRDKGGTHGSESMEAANDIEERDEGSEAGDKATIDCVREPELVELQSKCVQSSWSVVLNTPSEPQTVPLPVACTPLFAGLAGQGNRL